jgi:O-antigen ligase/tetratricopeptide (TPR) repeat protein
MNTERIVRSSIFALLFIVVIFPLVVANPLFFPFITGKALFFRIVVELAFAGWVILACMNSKYRPKITPLSIAVTAFTLITLLADLLGVSPLRSIWSNFERMEGWLMIVHLWGFFIVATSLFGYGEEGKRNWHKLFNFSLLISVIISIYGFLQFFGLAETHQGAMRIDATLGNSAYMAVYMLIHAFMAGYMFFSVRHNKTSGSILSQVVYAVIALSSIFLVFSTATRGSIIGVIGGIMLALFLHAVLGKNEKTKYRLISGGIIAVIVLIGITFWLNRDAQFIRSNYILDRLASISWSDNKTQARGYVWPMAIKGFTERPILGWGQENFNYVFNANYNPKMWSQEQWFDRAHSVFLDWLIASGALGILSYLSLYVFLLIAIWKSVLTVREKSVFTGLVAGYALHNVFVFDNLSSYALFFALLGFGASMSQNQKELFDPKPIQKDVVEYIVAPIMIVLLIGTLYFVNIRTIQANTRLIDAHRYCSSPNVQPDPAFFVKALEIDVTVANQEIIENLLSCAVSAVNRGNVSGPIKQSLIQLANEKMNAHITLYPDDVRMYMLGGSYLNNTGQSTDAVKLLETATKLSPNKQSIMAELAIAYSGTKDVQKAVDLLAQAYNLEKSNTKIRDIYARALVLNNREAEARKEFNNDPAIFDTEIMANTYIATKQFDKAIAIFDKIIAKDPKSIDNQFKKAQILFTADRKWEAGQLVKKMIIDFPEYKAQLEQALKEIDK